MRDSARPEERNLLRRRLRIPRCSQEGRIPSSTAAKEGDGEDRDGANRDRRHRAMDFAARTSLSLPLLVIEPLCGDGIGIRKAGKVRLRFVPRAGRFTPAKIDWALRRRNEWHTRPTLSAEGDLRNER